MTFSCKFNCHIVCVKIIIYRIFPFLEGFKEAAEKFQQESGVGPTVELNSLDDRIRIREAIQNGRIQEATDLVNQLHPELLDNDRYLYFHLQQLHLIELIRTGRIEEALQFAQDQLSEAGESDDNILSELERTLALLAFEEPHKSPFSDLLHPTHRQKVQSNFFSPILYAIIFGFVSCDDHFFVIEATKFRCLNRRSIVL